MSAFHLAAMMKAAEEIEKLQANPLRKAVEAMVVLMENGEWAEMAAHFNAPKDELAARLEECITGLHNNLHDAIDAPHVVVNPEGMTVAGLAALVGTIRGMLDVPVRNVADLDGPAHSREIGEAIDKLKAESPAAAVAAIKFSLEADEGEQFLQRWFDGDFDICRREWPEAPDECYIGANPLFKPTPAAPEFIGHDGPSGRDIFSKGVIEERSAADPEGTHSAEPVVSWWGDFLRARTRAIHAMNADGTPLGAIATTLNLAGPSHVERILRATKEPK